MFLIGDKIFYPVFGAGYILNIEDRIIQGEIKKYYIISFVNGMEAMIPVYSSEASRIRKVISPNECAYIMDILRHNGEVLPDKWNLRNRYYNECIRNGDIYRLALALSSIGDLAKKKELSKSEERVFQSMLELVAGEIALCNSLNLMDVKEDILKTLKSKDSKC